MFPALPKPESFYKMQTCQPSPNMEVYTWKVGVCHTKKLLEWDWGLVVLTANLSLDYVSSSQPDMIQANF